MRTSAPALSMCLSMVVATSCASISSVQTADTLGAKNWQVAVESGLQRVASPYLLVYPHFDASFRYGLTRKADLGVRFGYSGLELQGKFLLTRPENAALAISLAPSTGGATVPGTGPIVVIFNTALPVLVGLKHAKTNELVLGARLQGRVAVAPAQAAVLEAGVSVGYSLRIGERFGIFPEVAATIPLVQSGDASALLGTPSPHAEQTFINLFTVQAKLGFSFGRQRSR